MEAHLILFVIIIAAIVALAFLFVSITILLITLYIYRSDDQMGEESERLEYSDGRPFPNGNDPQRDGTVVEMKAEA